MKIKLIWAVVGISAGLTAAPMFFFEWHVSLFLGTIVVELYDKDCCEVLELFSNNKSCHNSYLKVVVLFFFLNLKNEILQNYIATGMALFSSACAVYLFYTHWAYHKQYIIDWSTTRVRVAVVLSEFFLPIILNFDK
jgi:hypothetical protein